MSLSELPLSYCTNVHPGRSVAEVEAGLDRYTLPIARAYARPLAAGLWLARPVVAELLESPGRVAQFTDALARRGLTCHTLNAFPYGDFHSTRVKENVYLPDWSQPERLDYTEQCASVLAAMLPAGVEGSISTLPLGFKEFHHPADFRDTAAAQLVECARRLADLHARTGKLIRLAVEPEPFCVIETTDEAVDFFRNLWREGDRRARPKPSAPTSASASTYATRPSSSKTSPPRCEPCTRPACGSTRSTSVCALQLGDPANNAEGRAALRRYVEPRYLHQTMARTPDGRVARIVDLTDEAIAAASPDFLASPMWRVHFHVPVDAEKLGPLATTRPALKEALAAVAALDYAPHLEVETYTWEVLPGAGPADLVEGLARELVATSALTATL